MIMMYNQTCKIASENHILSSKHSFNWIINCLSIENPKFSGLCHTSPLKQLSQEPAFTSHWSMICCASLCPFLSVSTCQWWVLEPDVTEATLYRRHWDDWCLLPGVNKSPSPLTRSSRVLHKDSSVSHLKWSVRLQKKIKIKDRKKEKEACMTAHSHLYRPYDAETKPWVQDQTILQSQSLSKPKQ